MRKFLTILIATIVAMVAFNIHANAQITISKGNNTPKMETTLAVYWNWIYSDSYGYHLVFKSTNQFDEYHFWLPLGKTKDECINSLDALIDACNTIGENEVFYVNDSLGGRLSMQKYNNMGLKSLYVTDTGHRYAGHGEINIPYMKKAKKWFENNL